MLILSFSAFSPAQAQCTAPDGVRGEQVYNVDHCVMQYCNGTLWMALGRPQAGCASANDSPFIIVIDSTLHGNADEVLIPTNPSFTYNYDVVWKDSTGTEIGNAAGLTGDFTITGIPGPQQGPVTVEISGDFPHWLPPGTNIGVVDVAQWGDIAWTSMASMFSSQSNFTSYTATDAPDLSAVTDMSAMFRSSPFNGDISAWNTANVINMRQMFELSGAFDQDIGGWNTSNVTDMSAMFNVAGSFNQDIGGWNTANVTSMERMFRAAAVFNQDIGAWSTSNVTDMSQMFNIAHAFNQDIGGWNTANVTNMVQMFRATHAFNQDIGGWNTASVTDMSAMFAFAQAFNQDLSGWCVVQIPSEPPFFDSNASSWAGGAATRPQWGEPC